MTVAYSSPAEPSAAACPPIVQVCGVDKVFSRQSAPVLHQITFTLAPGEILGLLGPSGCGKTTLLRIIAGFETPTTGEIYLEDRCVSGTKQLVPPEKRHTGMVFQDYALFPHLTIADNIAFGLQTKGQQLNRAQIKTRVTEVLNLVGLNGLEGRYPHELSGGQQQRIALARALAPRPNLILLDEPLSNLDVQVRQRLRHEIRHILKATGIAAIFVTHDQEEAMAISDRIGVMHQGRLEQIGTPEEIYCAPASRFVAEFVTQANFLPAQRRGEMWATEFGQWCLNCQDLGNKVSGELMLREEEILLQPDETSPVVIRDRQFLGREYRYCLETGTGQQIHARTSLETSIPVGSTVNLTLTNPSPPIFADQIPA
ncbi:MAG: ABC transporter ATP-binding protein [Synechocystis sp.]